MKTRLLVQLVGKATFISSILASTAVFTSPASAAILSTSANVSQIAAPANVSSPGTSNTNTNVWVERLNTAIGSGGLTTASWQSATTGGPATSGNTNPSGGTITAATVVNSYFVSFRPAGPGNTTSPTNNTITFTGNILGVLLSTAALSTTNAVALQSPTTTYSIIDGTVDSGNDSINISADRRTITFTLQENGGYDQLRIIEVPFEFESTAGLSLLGLWTGFSYWRKRRNGKQNNSISAK